MAYFAKLEFNVVQDVICIADVNCSGGVLPEADVSGASFIAQLGIAGEWILTGLNNPIRKNYAYIDCAFDAVRNAFIGIQPYSSWVMNEVTCRWEAPVPMPSEGLWIWDEATLSWFLTP